MKIPIRFVVWIWGRGVDDYETFCFPSVLQDGNLPWLARNGYAISLDFYTLWRDAARFFQHQRQTLAILIQLL